MVKIRSISIVPAVINSSCAWASDFAQLEALYESPFTGAVTTRTATLDGFAEDESHTVAFTSDLMSSINSYGYSPHPLSSYITWIRELLARNSPSSKPFIISIAPSSPSVLFTMLTTIQALRKDIADPARIAIELNTSCPNISGYPPPGYDLPSLSALLSVFAAHFWEDKSLTIGLKLPPYVHAAQFDSLVRVVAEHTRTQDGQPTNPFAFFTCTNTLGSSLLFANQTTDPSTDTDADFALPTGLGGLGGAAIHAIALGNVRAFSQRLHTSSDPVLRSIVLIGVGGVVDARSAERMRHAGADVVGCATLLGRVGVRGFETLSSHI